MNTFTTAPAPASPPPAATPALRVALLAPPTASVPPSSLGGLNQIRWLAEGLAERGHQVTLIGADLGGMVGSGYAVVDTDPTSGERASAEIIERLHAERAGKAVETLGQVDLVSDHTRTSWRPAGVMSLHARTVQTSYRPLVGLREPAPRVMHLGWVAISEHQRRNAPGLPWEAMIHPAVPVGEHPLNLRHNGAALFLGPLLERHCSGLALAAVHAAGLPIVLAGTQPSAEATAYTEVKLRPRLGSDDVLLERVGLRERWDLLAHARCLVAPLDPQVPYSLEIVEAMAYGTPVVTMVGTVGAELVTHGVSGLVLNDAAVLAEAIGKATRLDATLVREQAASRFDLPQMVDAYERLFVRLAAAGGC
jgi:Glycosyl transferases group 1